MPKDRLTAPLSKPCKAKSSRTGKPCKAWAIQGGTVCRTHGGGAPQVRAKAKKRLWDLIDPEGVLRRLAYIADFDPRELYDEHGALKHPKDWPEHVAKCISGMEVAKKNLTAGDGITDDVVKLKFWSKDDALGLFMKHLGLLTEKLDVNHGGKLIFTWASEEKGK
jgi:hypothetical protein